METLLCVLVARGQHEALRETLTRDVVDATADAGTRLLALACVCGDGPTVQTLAELYGLGSETFGVVGSTPDDSGCGKKRDAEMDDVAGDPVLRKRARGQASLCIQSDLARMGAEERARFLRELRSTLGDSSLTGAARLAAVKHHFAVGDKKLDISMLCRFEASELQPQLQTPPLPLTQYALERCAGGDRDDRLLYTLLTASALEHACAALVTPERGAGTRLLIDWIAARYVQTCRAAEVGADTRVSTTQSINRVLRHCSAHPFLGPMHVASEAHEALRNALLVACAVDCEDVTMRFLDMCAKDVDMRQVASVVLSTRAQRVYNAMAPRMAAACRGDLRAARHVVLCGIRKGNVAMTLDFAAMMALKEDVLCDPGIVAASVYHWGGTALLDMALSLQDGVDNAGAIACAVAGVLPLCGTRVTSAVLHSLTVPRCTAAVRCFVDAACTAAAALRLDTALLLAGRVVDCCQSTRGRDTCDSDARYFFRRVCETYRADRRLLRACWELVRAALPRGSGVGGGLVTCDSIVDVVVLLCKTTRRHGPSALRGVMDVLESATDMRRDAWTETVRHCCDMPDADVGRRMVKHVTKTVCALLASGERVLAAGFVAFVRECVTVHDVYTMGEHAMDLRAWADTHLHVCATPFFYYTYPLAMGACASTMSTTFARPRQFSTRRLLTTLRICAVRPEYSATFRDVYTPLLDAAVSAAKLPPGDNDGALQAASATTSWLLCDALAACSDSVAEYLCDVFVQREYAQHGTFFFDTPALLYGPDEHSRRFVRAPSARHDSSAVWARAVANGRRATVVSVLRALRKALPKWEESAPVAHAAVCVAAAYKRGPVQYGADVAEALGFEGVAQQFCEAYLGKRELRAMCEESCAQPEPALGEHAAECVDQMQRATAHLCRCLAVLMRQGRAVDGRLLAMLMPSDRRHLLDAAIRRDDVDMFLRVDAARDAPMFVAGAAAPTRELLSVMHGVADRASYGILKAVLGRHKLAPAPADDGAYMRCVFGEVADRCTVLRRNDVVSAIDESGWLGDGASACNLYLAVRHKNTPLLQYFFGADGDRRRRAVQRFVYSRFFDKKFGGVAEPPSDSHYCAAAHVAGVEDNVLGIAAACRNAEALCILARVPVFDSVFYARVGGLWNRSRRFDLRDLADASPSVPLCHRSVVRDVPVP